VILGKDVEYVSESNLEAVGEAGLPVDPIEIDFVL